MYAHFWVKKGKEAKENFHIHLSVLNTTFCVLQKVICESEKSFPTLFSNQTINLQSFF